MGFIGLNLQRPTLAASPPLASSISTFVPFFTP
jgi:hypothetical protein